MADAKRKGWICPKCKKCNTACTWICGHCAKEKRKMRERWQRRDG